MRLFLLATLLPFTACTSPGENGRGIPPVPPEALTYSENASDMSAFDAQAWLIEVREIGQYPEAETPEAVREMELAAAMDEQVGWKRACDTYHDFVTGEIVYDPVDESRLEGVRGRMEVADVSETEAVVSMTCAYGAYQGTYVFVHIDGDRAARLTARALDESSQPMSAEQTAFPEPFWDGLAETRTFSTFSKSRGLGDCGERVTYALSSDAPGESASTGSASGEMLQIREVRARACSNDIPDPLPPPTEWPVVYTAE